MIGENDEEFAGAAWDDVASGILVASDMLDRFRPEFVRIFVEGDITRKFAKALAEQLAPVEWTWPWFEEWEEFFVARGDWPGLWPALTPDEDEIDLYTAEELAEWRRRELAPLIVHTAMMKAYTSRQLSRYPDQYIWTLTAFPGEPAGMWVTDQYRPAIEASDFSVVPPFFPGDRTTLQQVGLAGTGHKWFDRP